MAFKVFLDANILLDFTLKRSNYEDAKTIVRWAEEKRISAYVSPTVVQIIAYWMTKAYGSEKTKQLIGALLSFVRTIDTPQERVLMAVHSSMDDIEDALLYYTALHHRLDYILTRDKDFQKSAMVVLPVISPETFIGIMTART